MADRDNIQKWVEALRSGLYKQGRHALKRGDYYCCLGVACEVYRGQHPHVEWTEDGHGHAQFMGSLLTIPKPVKKWLGFKENSEVPSALAELNDQRRYNFAQIAADINLKFLAEGVEATLEPGMG